MAEPINDRPLNYQSDNGTGFKASRSDMAEGLEIIKPEGMSELAFAQDMFEFGWYFTTEIQGKLNSFRGFKFTQYATIRTREA